MCEINYTITRVFAPVKRQKGFYAPSSFSQIVEGREAVEEQPNLGGKR
jgi:hypothetical protein